MASVVEISGINPPVKSKINTLNVFAIIAHAFIQGLALFDYIAMQEALKWNFLLGIFVHVLTAIFRTWFTEKKIALSLDDTDEVGA